MADSKYQAKKRPDSPKALDIDQSPQDVRKESILNSLTYEQVIQLSTQRLVDTVDRNHETADETPGPRFEAKIVNFSSKETLAWA